TEPAERPLQPPDRGELDLVLAQRRQHLLDVTEEHRARADEQDAVAPELPPVGVEEVRGAVQRHRGLAGARTSPHDQRAGERRPQPPDVEAVALGEVEAAEAEGRVADVERSEAPVGGFDGDVRSRRAWWVPPRRTSLYASATDDAETRIASRRS